MKLVVFAHKPPPLHGQSYMVQLLLDGFGGDRRTSPKTRVSPANGIECYHVNARVSKNLEDVGGARFGKLFWLFWHCLQAIWCRFRYGATNFYYVPAPGKRAALYRDWLVMALCRPFFRRVVLHWHATSLSKWLETSTSISTRGFTYRLMGEADLSVVLSQHNRHNAEKLWPRKIAVVANGIPDPCPNFEVDVLPRRNARAIARSKLVVGQRLSDQERAAAGNKPELVRALFLAHCTREKGLFDAVHAVLYANDLLRTRQSPIQFELVVTGVFPNADERREFERLQKIPGGEAIQYPGFVTGAQKTDALAKSDILCFPSHWENQPVSVIEALAFGLPAIISRLPSVQEMLPAGYAGVADVEDSEQLAAAMIDYATFDGFTTLREHFLHHFTQAGFFSNLAQALQSLETEGKP